MRKQDEDNLAYSMTGGDEPYFVNTELIKFKSSKIHAILHLRIKHYKAPVEKYILKHILGTSVLWDDFDFKFRKIAGVEETVWLLALHHQPISGVTQQYKAHSSSSSGLTIQYYQGVVVKSYC